MLGRNRRTRLVVGRCRRPLRLLGAALGVAFQQQTLQRIAGAADAALHRANRHASVLGNDLVRQALEDRQQQRLALRRRKLGKGRDELAHHQAAVLVRRMRQRFGDRGVDRHGRTLAAQARNELVALDAEQPRRQVGARLEAVASGQRLDHSVVDQVICRVTITRQRQCVDPEPRKDRLQLQ